MAKNVTLIIIGLVSTIVLAFASHESNSRVVRTAFWICLAAAAVVIIYSGVDSIRISRDLTVLKQDAKKNAPFKISENDVEALNQGVKQLVIEERKAQGNPPNVHFLTFPGQSSDAIEFQEILKHSFEQAGKKTESHHNLAVTGTHLNGSPWDGVIIQVNDPGNPPIIAAGLFKLLVHLRIKVWSHQGSGYGSNDIVIYSQRPSYVRNGNTD